MHEYSLPVFDEEYDSYEEELADMRYLGELRLKHPERDGLIEGWKENPPTNTRKWPRSVHQVLWDQRVDRVDSV